MAGLFDKPVEELILEKIECGCGRTHKCDLSGILIEHGAVEALPALIAPYKEKTIFLIGDGNTMIALGNKVVGLLANDGFSVRKFVFPSRPVLRCDRAAIGELTVAVPRDAGLILAVGAGTICDLAKYLSFKSGLPLVFLATAASSDSYAVPFTETIEDDGVTVLRSAEPRAIIADLDVINAAPKKLTVSGVGNALSKFVSVFDWYLSNAVTGTYFCPKIAKWVLNEVREVGSAVSRGYAPGTDELCEPLTRCLITCSVACTLAGTLQLARGSESALAEYLYDRAIKRKGNPDMGMLRGFSACQCIQIYDSLSARLPDFVRGKEALEEFSWVDYNREMVRVYADRAQGILSATDGMYFSDDEHYRRVCALERIWKELVTDQRKLVPPFRQFLPLFKILSMPSRFAQLGLAREDAADALNYGFLLTDRYNLFSMLWDLGLLERVAQFMTKDLKVSPNTVPKGFVNRVAPVATGSEPPRGFAMPQDKSFLV